MQSILHFMPWQGSKASSFVFSSTFSLLTLFMCPLVPRRPHKLTVSFFFLTDDDTELGVSDDFILRELPPAD